MEIKITKSILLKNGEFLVSFESKYGDAEGVWTGKEPAFNEMLDVEIDIEDKMVWLMNAFKSSEKVPLIEKSDKKITILAIIESIEQDGCCVLKLGDSIIMTEIENIPNLEKGTFVRLKVNNIKLFNSNL